MYVRLYQAWVTKAAMKSQAPICLEFIVQQLQTNIQATPHLHIVQVAKSAPVRLVDHSTVFELGGSKLLCCDRGL